MNVTDEGEAESATAQTSGAPWPSPTRSVVDGAPAAALPARESAATSAAAARRQRWGRLAFVPRPALKHRRPVVELERAAPVRVRSRSCPGPVSGRPRRSWSALRLRRRSSRSRLGFASPTRRPSCASRSRPACALIALLASYLVLGRFLRARHLDSLVLAASLGVLSCASLVAAAMLAFPPSEDGRIVCERGDGDRGDHARGLGVRAAAPAGAARNEVLALGAATGLLVVVVGGALALIDHLFPPGAVELARNAEHPHLESARGAARGRVGGDGRVPRRGRRLRPAAAVRRRLVLLVPRRRRDARRARAARLHPVRVRRRRARPRRRRLPRALLRGAARRRRARDRRVLARGWRRPPCSRSGGGSRATCTTGSRRSWPSSAVARRGSRRRATRRRARSRPSAERALGDSRRAIAALTRPLDQPLDEVLTEAVEEVASRYDVRLDLAFEPGVRVAADAREALVRIACEAVSNAARPRAREGRPRLARRRRRRPLRRRRRRRRLRSRGAELVAVRDRDHARARAGRRRLVPAPLRARPRHRAGGGVPMTTLTACARARADRRRPCADALRRARGARGERPLRGLRRGGRRRGRGRGGRARAARAVRPRHPHAGRRRRRGLGDLRAPARDEDRDAHRLGRRRRPLRRAPRRRRRLPAQGRPT